MNLILKGGGERKKDLPGSQTVLLKQSHGNMMNHDIQELMSKKIQNINSSPRGKIQTQTGGKPSPLGGGGGGGGGGGERERERERGIKKYVNTTNMTRTLTSNVCQWAHWSS